MWLLDARIDAEKIDYQAVGEKTKEASNVIDYDIKEEQTIEQSSVFNANNDTTTGMANVIPWVNAPKLKFSTSIYMDTEIVVDTVWQELKAQWNTINRPWETSTYIRAMTNLSNWWTQSFKYYSSPQWTLWSWMQAPVEWNYQFEVTYPWTSTSYWWTFEWRTPKWWWSLDTVWRTYSTVRNSQDETETFIRKFDKWEVFWIFATMNRSSSTPLSDAPIVYIKITKI